MVKKLLKHEFIAYLRIWIPMQIILLVVAFFGRILQFFKSDSNIYSLIRGSSVVIYVVAIIAAIGLTFVFGIVRFYKNLFSGEGYLSFTLPVTISDHLWTKMLAAGCFNIFTFVSVLISLAIMTSGKRLSDALKTLSDIVKAGYSYVGGTNMTLYILEGLALLLLTAFTQILLFYACIALGQLFRKNRVIGAVVVYFVYYTVTQILSTILVVILTMAGSFLPLNRFAQFVVDHPLGTIHLYMCGLFILQLAMSIVYYVVTHTVIRKKLNLE